MKLSKSKLFLVLTVLLQFQGAFAGYDALADALQELAGSYSSVTHEENLNRDGTGSTTTSIDNIGPEKRTEFIVHSILKGEFVNSTTGYIRHPVDMHNYILSFLNFRKDILQDPQKLKEFILLFSKVPPYKGLDAAAITLRIAHQSGDDGTLRKERRYYIVETLMNMLHKYKMYPALEPELVFTGANDAKAPLAPAEGLGMVKIPNLSPAENPFEFNFVEIGKTEILPLPSGPFEYNPKFIQVTRKSETNSVWLKLPEPKDPKYPQNLRGGYTWYHPEFSVSYFDNAFHLVAKDWNAGIAIWKSDAHGTKWDLVAYIGSDREDQYDTNEYNKKTVVLTRTPGEYLLTGFIQWEDRQSLSYAHFAKDKSGAVFFISANSTRQWRAHKLSKAAK